MKSKKPVVKQGGNSDQPHRWRKGQSGNPKGRPRVGESIAEFFRSLLAEEDPKKKKQRVLVVFEKAYANTIGPRKDAAKWASLLLSYSYGKPIETVKVEGLPDLGSIISDAYNKRLQEQKEEQGEKNADSVDPDNGGK